MADKSRFGTWPVLSDLVTTWGPIAVIAGWGSIILQMAFPFLLLSRPTRVFALIGILGFHIGIAVLMGLPWFSLTMVAIDSIFIRDRTWSAMQRRIVTTWRTAVSEPRSRSGARSGSTREDRVEEHLGDLALGARR